eukprot:3450201-Pyramimonas_sp.AAC.1
MLPQCGGARVPDPGRRDLPLLPGREYRCHRSLRGVGRGPVAGDTYRPGRSPYCHPGRHPLSVVGAEAHLQRLHLTMLLP